MAGLLQDKCRRLRTIALVLALPLAIAAGMLLGLTSGVFQGPRDARAQAAVGATFELCKEWNADGPIGEPRDFLFDVSDTEENQTFVIPDVVEDGPSKCILISAALGLVNISEQIPDGFRTPVVTIPGGPGILVTPHAPFILTAIGCSYDNASTETLQRGVESLEVVTVGPAVCTVGYLNEEEPSATFELCKEWTHEGVAAPRAFSFEISDAQESETLTIPGVVSGGGPSCIFVSAHEGLVRIDEQLPAGFDTPEWAFNGLFGGVGSHAEFILFQQECFSDTSPSLIRGTEALVTQVSSGPAACRITFINRSEGPPEVTTTPPPEVCAVCNRTTTPPPATSTPAPPTNTPAPSTPVPPTATTSTGTQAPGLTDEQRTATAVAGAKTAAAQVTPIAPKTGAGGAGGSAQGTNLALIVIAMAMVGGGLSLIASRRRL